MSADLRQLGQLLLGWHKTAGDPIYTVGLFFVTGKDCQDIETVQKARSAILGLERAARTSAPANRRHGAELRTIVRGLDGYLKSKGVDVKIAKSKARETVWVELTVKIGKDGDAFAAVDDALDTGVFQDAINERGVRVLSATSRAQRQ